MCLSISIESDGSIFNLLLLLRLSKRKRILYNSDIFDSDIFEKEYDEQFYELSFKKLSVSCYIYSSCNLFFKLNYILY
jgi:hypothetical protein